MRKSLLFSCLTMLCATPAFAEDITIAESSPNLVATSDATINTSQSINLQKGQEKLQLFLTYYNGDATAPGFTTLRISSSSLPYVSEQAFGKNKSVTTNVTGDLGWGGNQILITARGPKGATFGWRLTTPKPVITSLSPESVGAGSTLAINGTNLCSDPADNEVLINGKKAQIVSATASQIVVKVPEVSAGGSTTVTVNGAGLDAGKLPLSINAVPYLKGLSATWAWLNTPVTITGENFGTNAADVAVYMGPLRAPVDSVTPTQIVFRIPEGFYNQGASTWGYNQPLKVIVNGVRSRNTLIMSTGDQIGI
ncbi:MAG TPA: IPT/TIG domain-containing protein [Drouetiella sp.]|jgi:IPT/TIG domain